MLVSPSSVSVHHLPYVPSVVPLSITSALNKASLID